MLSKLLIASISAKLKTQEKKVIEVRLIFYSPNSKFCKELSCCSRGTITGILESNKRKIGLPFGLLEQKFESKYISPNQWPLPIS